MPDALATITKIISEHHAIRGHIKLLGDTVNDIEALFALQRTQSGRGQTSMNALVEKRDGLLQTVSFLEEGLRNHFDFEEKALPPLVGELLMKAILHEHHRISGQLGGAKTILAGVEVGQLDERELLSRKSAIQQSMDSLRQTVEEHARHEEVILAMIRNALAQNTE
jgi:hypothetical protein